MRIFKLLITMMAFSGVAVAEKTKVIYVSAVSVVQDTILPQLSFAAQQARAAELIKQAEARVKQEIGNNALLLSEATMKVYLDNQFAIMWHDKVAQKAFLKEYALFAASGVSSKSAKALQQILNQPEGLAKDILLTDSFLDYLYYNKNVFKQANNWLYDLGSYTPKAPSSEQITQWTNAVKMGVAGEFVTNLVPQNHLYRDTAQRVLATAGEVVNNAFYKLALNVQRLRIIPSFDNGIFVNIPSYQLYYFRDGVLSLQSKVIVGRVDRKTPVMYSKLSNVVVNPPWNVPSGILAKDIIPKLAQDPGYAERASFEILDSGGNQIDPHSVNWSEYLNAKRVPYRIRQKAGDDSALGRYKFNMPTTDAIFLHDTPNRGLFGRKNRNLSSGCVRVEKSDELATILLKEAGWGLDKKKRVLSSKKTTSAQIHSDNPVYLYYVTAWVEGGKVQTLPDIYHFDVNIPQFLISWKKLKSLI